MYILLPQSEILSPPRQMVILEFIRCVSSVLTRPLSFSKNIPSYFYSPLMVVLDRVWEFAATVAALSLMYWACESAETFSLLNSYTSQQRFAVQALREQNTEFITTDEIFPQSRNLTLVRKYDERLPVVAVYRQLSRALEETNGKLSNWGIPFHWDDWMNLGHARVLLDAYEASKEHSITNYAKLWEALRSNDWYRSRETPILSQLLHSDVWIYGFVDSPDQVMAFTNGGYYEVPVVETKIVGEQGLWDQVYGQKNAYRNPHSLGSINLKEEAEQLDHITQKYESPYNTVYDWDTPIPEEIKYTKQDFEWDLPAEIERYEKMPDKSPKEVKYLDTLKLCQDRSGPGAFFMYPINWLENDRYHKGQHTNFPFFQSLVDKSRRRSPIHHMMRNFAKMMRVADCKYWVFSGNAISWYFNGNNMPWDEDIDVRMTTKEMGKMALAYNNTLVIENPAEGDGMYLFQISPWFGKTTRIGNHIDSRFIDIKTGLYIDVTSLNVAPESREKVLKQNHLFEFRNVEKADRSTYLDRHTVINDKNGNWFWLDDFDTQFRTLFEGTMIHMPYNYDKTLRYSYGDRVLTKTRCEYYRFVSEISMWIDERTCNFDKYNKLIKAGLLYDKNGHLTLAGACGDREVLDEWNRVHPSFRMHLEEMNLLKNGDNGHFKYSAKDLPIAWHDSFTNLFDYYETEGSGSI